MEYLTLTEYENMTGTKMDPVEFARQEFRARKTVDAITLGRVKGDSTQREAVKRLMCELIALFADNEATKQATSAASSWSNDGVSATIKLADPLTATQLERQSYALARDYLISEVSADGVPLLYRGVDVCL